MNFPLQKLCILTVCFDVFLYLAFCSLHHAYMILAALSLITTPPFSHLTILLIIMSSVFLLFLAFNITKDTNKNLLCFPLKVIFLPPIVVLWNILWIFLCGINLSWKPYFITLFILFSFKMICIYFFIRIRSIRYNIIFSFICYILF